MFCSLNSRRPVAVLGLLAFSTISTIEPSYAQATLEFEFKGRVEPRQRVQIANQVTGVVEQVHVEAGHIVKVGDLLFSIDASSFRLDVEVAEAEVLEARAKLELAEDIAARRASLEQRGSGASAAAKQSALEASMARAVLKRAEAQLSLASLALKRTEIRSPINGIAQRPRVSPGAFVEAEGGTVLGEIVQTDPVLVAYQITYADRQAVLSATGTTLVVDLYRSIKLKLRLPSGAHYPEGGRALFESAEIDPATQAITVWGEFPNPTGVLIPGLDVTVLSSFER
ncbi:MAG: efflux RND transporter periplasmic adaptor subunit [Hyphomicrobium sp.]|nr:efflux RND transporter periplasmic adaptor subunit [Hyphomicrobium sp.]